MECIKCGRPVEKVYKGRGKHYVCSGCGKHPNNCTCEKIETNKKGLFAIKNLMIFILLAIVLYVIVFGKLPF